MSTRHVWQKSDVRTYFVMPDMSQDRDDKMGKTKKYSAYNSDYKESGTTELAISKSDKKFIYYTEYNGTGIGNDDFVPVDAYVRYSSGDTYGSLWYVKDYDLRQGETVLGILSGAASKYPGDGALYSVADERNYYYELLGSDTIDPSAVSILDTPKAGKEVAVSVAPVTNTYGGTISYAYEYSADGGASWQAIQTTTATEISMPVPEDAEILQVRVRASDDMGFTSADYVVSEAVAVKAAGGVTLVIDGIMREADGLYCCVDGIMRPVGSIAVIDGIQRDIF